MKSININWIQFTTLLAGRIIDDSIEHLTNNDRVNVLIIDDTTFERSRSKKVELLAKIYDHAKKQYKYGFRLLKKQLFQHLMYFLIPGFVLHLL
jgi:DNA replication protein DnaC